MKENRKKKNSSRLGPFISRAARTARESSMTNEMDGKIIKSAVHFFLKCVCKLTLNAGVVFNNRELKRIFFFLFFQSHTHIPITNNYNPRHLSIKNMHRGKVHYYDTILYIC